MVAFLNTQTFGSDETWEEAVRLVRDGNRFRVRLMLNKRSQTNLCFDIGWARMARTPCTSAVQEAF